MKRYRTHGPGKIGDGEVRGVGYSKTCADRCFIVGYVMGTVPQANAVEKHATAQVSHSETEMGWLMRVGESRGAIEPLSLLVGNTSVYYQGVINK
jgi:hypothetical protein